MGFLKLIPQLNESFDEQVSRVRLMAEEDSDWDLSDNDRAALNALLRVVGGTVEDAIICALRNSGIDVTCGACMEVAFTGTTTNVHTCAESEATK